MSASEPRESSTPIRHAGSIVLVQRNSLSRECLARSLVAYNPALSILTVDSLHEAKVVANRQSEIAAILLVVGHRSATDQTTQIELKEFASCFEGAPLILVADAAGPAEILAALEGGAKGYVSTGERIAVLAEAIALARSGGTFVPASCILELKSAIQSTANNGTTGVGVFTPREASVANALRKGKANKIIAYELNMCESTVKVHIHNIMRKLGATNRAEVAFKLSKEMAA
jgi:DNA-binding NarL/FixJ family response regulator